jgi:hypothetical protein
MNSVITVSEARKITGGRMPHVPVEYEAAVKALQACLTLDEAKYWNDKADALAAWAKIYQSKEAEQKARQLKLHAFRRMGILAGELRPGKGARTDGRSGMAPGPHSLLKEKGLTGCDASAARKLATLTPNEFKSFVNQRNPPSPSLVQRHVADKSQSYKDLFLINSSISSFRSYCKNTDAKKLAEGFRPEELEKVRECLAEIFDWLDNFERCIPGSKRKK